jgi:uncharacterized protein (DUF58 family)
MIRPTPRCVLLLAGGVPVALVPALVAPRLWTLWLTVLALSLLAAGLDLVLGIPSRRLRVDADAPATLYIGERDPLRLVLRVENALAAADAEVVCDLDPALEPQAMQPLRLPASGTTTAEVPLVPLRRGTVTIDGVWLRWSGPLGLVQRIERRSVQRSVAVLPNLRAVRAAALRFFAAKEFLAGLKVERTLGDGSEFSSLREFLPGLDAGAIDWKASARHSKLLCREYRAERNHQVVLAFDTGRLMGEPLEGIPRLDHAINAGLLLGYVCLKTGDRVGLFSFDEKVRTFAEPKGGLDAFARLQRRAAELDYSAAETNYTLALTELASRLRRRSLVLVMTDFVDTVTAELMVENLERLARRHLVVFAAMRDPGIARLVEARPRDLDDLGRAVVAHDLLQERDLVLRRLRRSGIACIDAQPGGLSAQLVNRYLDIKRRELV